MFYWLKGIINDFNNWLFPEIKLIYNKLDHSQNILANMSNILTIQQGKLEYELAFYKNFTELLIDESPDMVWLKDSEGKYLIANKSIKEGLLFDCDPIGKNDIELSLKAKEVYGNENHTFGEICGNSDKVIMKTLKPQRFLESGKVKGKMIYLEVNKFPFYIHGEFIGVGGVGRDITTYVEAYRDSNCKTCSSAISDIFEKYEFKG